MLQEDLQALTFHGRQQEKDTCARGRFHRGIKPEPLILVLHDPGRPCPHWTPAPPQPRDQAKAPFIQGHNALERGWLYQAPKVFLKAACCSALAFLWRRR